MNTVNLELLDELLIKASRLKDLLESNPNLLRFMELLKATNKSTIEIPVPMDRLIGPQEAMQVLKISSSRLEEYVKSGVLTAYRTPPASGRKFWLSDVKGIPIKEVI